MRSFPWQVPAIPMRSARFYQRNSPRTDSNGLFHQHLHHTLQPNWTVLCGEGDMEQLNMLDLAWATGRYSINLERWGFLGRILFRVIRVMGMTGLFCGWYLFQVTCCNWNCKTNRHLLSRVVTVVKNWHNNFLDWFSASGTEREQKLAPVPLTAQSEPRENK